MKGIYIWLSILTLLVGTIYWYAFPIVMSLIELGEKYGG